MPGKIKKILMGVGALGALALGGSALATAQNPAPSTSAQPPAAEAPGTETNDAQGAAEQPGTETNDAQGAAEQPGTETNDGQDAGEQQATGPEADKAKQAALDSVGSGKVTDVSADGGEKPDPNEKPDPGEAAPPAYEAQIAWDVEVTKADGSAVDVHLDKAFKVLGTENANQQGD